MFNISLDIIIFIQGVKMKNIFIVILIANSLLLAVNSDKERETRSQNNIQKAIEKEKKYSKEQTFYLEKNYDLKAAEVNPDSLSSIPDIEPDDFDMDDVY